MNQPINFNKARKARIKAEAKATAAENRVRFGQPKADRARREREDVRAARDLDGKKRG